MDAARDVLCRNSSSLHVYRFLDIVTQVEGVAGGRAIEQLGTDSRTVLIGELRWTEGVCFWSRRWKQAWFNAAMV